MCKVKRIDDFLVEWPDAEFGPGHIVLGDCNLRDSDLDSCLESLDYLFDGKPPSSPRKQQNCDDLHNKYPHTKEEMLATREFLYKLRALPPRRRIEEGDLLCGGESLEESLGIALDKRCGNCHWYKPGVTEWAGKPTPLIPWGECTWDDTGNDNLEKVAPTWIVEFVYSEGGGSSAVTQGDGDRCATFKEKS